jgi:hypothetical protein
MEERRNREALNDSYFKVLPGNTIDVTFFVAGRIRTHVAQIELGTPLGIRIFVPLETDAFSDGYDRSSTPARPGALRTLLPAIFLESEFADRG